MWCSKKNLKRTHSRVGCCLALVFFTRGVLTTWKQTVEFSHHHHLRRGRRCRCRRRCHHHASFIIIIIIITIIIIIITIIIIIIIIIIITVIIIIIIIIAMLMSMTKIWWFESPNRTTEWIPVANSPRFLNSQLVCLLLVGLFWAIDIYSFNHSFVRSFIYLFIYLLIFSLYYFDSDMTNQASMTLYFCDIC